MSMQKSGVSELAGGHLTGISLLPRPGMEVVEEAIPHSHVLMTSFLRTTQSHVQSAHTQPVDKSNKEGVIP